MGFKQALGTRDAVSTSLNTNIKQCVLSKTETYINIYQIIMLIYIIGIMIMQGDYTKSELRLRICSHLFKIVGVIALIIWDNIKF